MNPPVTSTARTRTTLASGPRTRVVCQEESSRHMRTRRREIPLEINNSHTNTGLIAFQMKVGSGRSKCCGNHASDWVKQRRLCSEVVSLLFHPPSHTPTPPGYRFAGNLLWCKTRAQKRSGFNKAEQKDEIKKEKNRISQELLRGERRRWLQDDEDRARRSTRAKFCRGVKSGEREAQRKTASARMVSFCLFFLDSGAD